MIENSLWIAVPDFLRELSTQVAQVTGEELPPWVAPIRLCSWMGGDRDGNPMVTSYRDTGGIVTCTMGAADLYSRDLTG